ncbi:tripartite tricarboxylate transporter substrate binding protein [Dankookia sp. GCM10030260]|uniref:tripartite tricarboxylate transporter substrate binding protein n=1 Tax=Dankookia sp. GCM10030260 TaxID=3273390 RepID=UPI003608EED8
MPTRRGALAALPALLAAPALAQAPWPAARAIEVFVPFPAGGGVDTMVRGILAQVAPRLPGARFVVTNRPGAGGQLGFEANFNAAPDGYTLGAATNTAMNAISVERTPRYRPAEFTYIANVVDDPAAFWVHPDSPWKDLADLAAAARAQPEAFGVGTAGVGSDDHILQLTFEEASGARLIHIPYNGTAPTLRDLLGGRLPIGSFNMGEGVTLLREGRIRCLGQAGPRRWEAAADIPTFREQGFDILGGSARGIAGPPGIPLPIRDALREAFRGALADPAFVAEAARLNLPLRPLIGEDYAAMMAADLDSLRRLWARRPWKD